MATLRLGHDQMFQPALCIPAFRHGLMRIFVTQLRQIKRDLPQQVGRFGNGVRTMCEKIGHLPGRFEIPLRIAVQSGTSLCHRDAEGYCRQDIVQGPVPALCIEDVVRGEQGNPQMLGQKARLFELAPVAALKMHGHPQPDAVGRAFFQAQQNILDPLRRWLHQAQPLAAVMMIIGYRPALRRIFLRRGHRQKDEEYILRVRRQIVEIKDAAPLFRPHIPGCQKPGQPSPPQTGAGIGDNIRRPVGKDQPRAGYKPETLGQ